MTQKKIGLRQVRRWLRVLIRLAFVVVAVRAAQAAERIDLNGDWRFRIDRDERGEKLGWNAALMPGTEVVRVPHTWNLGKYDDYEGVAWYFRSFALDPAALDEHVELHFAATFYKSRVWLNGKFLGAHEGGHTPYWFDISSTLRGGENFLAVELDNRPTADSIPGFAGRLRAGGDLWYDWWHYGGIVRDVSITVNHGGLIRRERIQSKIREGEAEVTTDVFLENLAGGPERFRVQATLYSPAGDVAGQNEVMVAADSHSLSTPLKFTIKQPELWNLDHPALYRMAVRLVNDHGRLLDEREDSFGLRTIEIRDRHLFLNGDQVRLTGMTRHEDSPWEGLAETAGTIKNDYDALAELHVRLTRPVHYPQHELILDYADRHGILLIPEIPMWQFDEEQMKNPKVIRLAKQIFKEMIEEDENHPSIFAWSLCNESAASTPGGRAYIDTMRDWVRQLDPGRYVSYADNDLARGPDPKTEAANDVDFIMMNAYFGTWMGSADDLLPRMQEIGRDYPTKMVIVSEFGYPGVFSPDSATADKMRVRTMERQLDEFARFDFVAGAIFWCYQDYKSHLNLWPGYQEGYVDHGVVDEYRQRRPSFAVWEKANQPVVFSGEKWVYDGKGNRAGFEVELSPRTFRDIPSYPLRNGRANWELRDRDGRLITVGEQSVPELLPGIVVHGAWDGNTSPWLHLQVTFFDAMGHAEAATAIDAHPVSPGGETIDEMKQTPH
jgi:beta-glucuronidase